MSEKRDELGRFLEAYELYFKGELEYHELPQFGCRVDPPVEKICTRCQRKYMRKAQLIQATARGSAIWSYGSECYECQEIERSGPQQPLPVAKVIKR